MKAAEDAGDRASRLVVIGAGVSGLSAAFVAAREAAEAGLDLEVLVLERGDRVAGRAVSEQEDGWLVETGPGGYLDTDAEMAALVEDAGLGDRVVRADPAAAKRYVFRNGRPNYLSPLAMMRSGLLGPLSMLRLLGDVVLPSRPPSEDESVRDFLARRFGSAVADRLGRVAMLGIFAGDAERLSMAACFPELPALEREAGSVIRGAIRRRRNRKDDDQPTPSRRLTSFHGGLRELPETLAAHPDIGVRTGVTVIGLVSAEGPGGETRGFEILTEDGETIAADAVIVATSVKPAAQLLASVAPAAASALGEIPTPPVTVVALGYRLEDVAALPTGFGTLVTRGEGYRMLGVLHEWQIYPGRAPSGHALVRVMYGGRVDPEVTGLEDAEIENLAHDELRRAFGVTGSPVRSWTFRWPRAIPQYEIGHPDRARSVKRALEAAPGLYLAGDSLAGVSYVKTAVAGMNQARSAVAELVRRPRRATDTNPSLVASRV